MKVLALHGKQQNAEVFRSRCEKLTARSIRDHLVSKFHFHDAPHCLPLKDGDQVPMRTWYLRNKDGSIDSSSLEVSLVEIEELWKLKGPFDGILGFSMGGAMASIVASNPKRFPCLKFVLVAGAPDTDTLLTIPACVKSLHMIGLDDKTVTPRNSHNLADKFANPNIVEHEMGHCLPMKSGHLQEYLSFLQNMKSLSVTSAPSSLPEPQLLQSAMLSIASDAKSATKATMTKKAITLHHCASDEIATLQAEEVEVLSAIYPDEFTLVAQGSSLSESGAEQPAVPTKRGDLCASFHVKLVIEPDQIDPEFVDRFPRQWIGQIGLHFTLPSNYPLLDAPIVTISTGKLNLSDGFSDSLVSSLENAIQMACGGIDSGSCLGEACGMLAIQTASDWFCNGMWTKVSSNAKSGSNDTSAVSAEDTEEDSSRTGLEEQGYYEEVDEVAEAESIRLATAEAYEKAYLARLEATRPLNAQDKSAKADKLAREAALLPPSARGVWGYTVGLVGKPSAGKSTFYNAVTRAALERGGRLMAEVAPHPFTTIEPNIGPGWYASFEQESEYTLEAENTVTAAGTTSSLSSGALSGEHSDGREQFRRYPLHGRVPATTAAKATSSAVTYTSYVGHRLLPVVVKDVAGLVPGAYKGRGKGNRFLADLCDADVLVHVVDVTGQADRDGNTVITADIASDTTETAGEASTQSTAEDKGSTPMEDAEWIREELHRWIYGNVRGKWSSVLACTRTKVPGVKQAAGKPADRLITQQQRDRAAQRVLALFTGYQGPRWCVELAAERAGLQLEHAGTWTSRDLHRMVAHFLSIRFPVCLALNKIDALDKSPEKQAIITHCQETARLRGEAAVPVSARAECWLLSKQAAAAAESGVNGTANATKKVTAVAALKEEAICQAVLAQFGTTGVLEAISEAVKLRPPVLCYPVCDLDSECPVGWTAGKSNGLGATSATITSTNINDTAHNSVHVCGSTTAAAPRLQDCLQLKPGSTVGDVFEALKRGALSHSAIVQGEFVRADGRGLTASRVVQLRKDSVVDGTNCLLRIQTNRKSVWQGGSGGHTATSTVNCQ